MYRKFVRNEPKEERSISGFEKQVAGHIYFHVQGEESELIDEVRILGVKED